MAQSSTDTLILGAGPYGVSLAAHLRRAGVDHRVFGPHMGAWAQMPKGMRLRSAVSASSLSDPVAALTIEKFHAARGLPLEAPIPLERFLDYADWFTDQAEVETDPRLVATLGSRNGGFRAVLTDGDEVEARRVVIAAGAQPFEWIPPEFRDLPAGIASHAGDHRDLGVFAGKELVVVGSGQSAIECAALAHEGGAHVRVLFRAPGIHWLTRSAWLHASPMLNSLLYAPSDVGPAGLSRIVSVPRLVRLLPPGLREKATIRSVRPAAGAWLIERTKDIPMTPGRQIRGVTSDSERVRIACDDGEVLEADHVLLATGYKIDLSRYSFIAPDLLAAIRSSDGFPALDRTFASSVRGLRIIGWPATRAYGPLMRFVCGADFAARAVTRSLLSRRSRRATAGA